MNSSNAESAARFEARVRARCESLLGTCSHLVLAYSGGRDSTVLLQVLAKFHAQWGVTLTACHVDHALHPASSRWAEHCAAECAALGIPLVCERIRTPPPVGASIEAWAREVRYGALMRHCTAEVLLLTAHHADDQAETFFLNALRGSGPAGLQGIAPRRALGAGWLGRPLLEVSSAEIEAYALTRGVRWCEDPSNQALRFRRNYLRHQVLPALRERWPQLTTTLGRTVSLQRDLDTALNHAADQLLQHQGVAMRERIACRFLLDQPLSLRAVLVRRWLSSNGCQPPAARQLEQVMRCVLHAGADRNPQVTWNGHTLRRYRAELYLCRSEAPLPGRFETHWQMAAPLILPWGRLTATVSAGPGLRVSAVGEGGIQIRLRQGGERCRLIGRAHHARVKHLLQEAGIPPWQRTGLPLLYIDERLAAIPNIGVCDEFAAASSELGVIFEWRPS